MIVPCTEPGAKDVVINDIGLIPIMKALNFTDGTIIIYLCTQ